MTGREGIGEEKRKKKMIWRRKLTRKRKKGKG